VLDGPKRFGLATPLRLTALAIVTRVEIRRVVRLRNRVVMRGNCPDGLYPRAHLPPQQNQPIQHR